MLRGEGGQQEDGKGGIEGEVVRSERRIGDVLGELGPGKRWRAAAKGHGHGCMGRRQYLEVAALRGAQCTAALLKALAAHAGSKAAAAKEPNAGAQDKGDERRNPPDECINSVRAEVADHDIPEALWLLLWRLAIGAGGRGLDHHLPVLREVVYSEAV